MRPFSLLALALLAPHLTAAPPDFDRDIAPLLAARCLDCHSGDKPKGRLDLSRRAGALGGGAPAVVPGKPDDSSVWERVASGEMPPKKPLPAAEQKLLKDWIAAGAKWGTDPIDPFRVTTAARAGRDWWALRPLARPKVPGPPAPHPIDGFVRAKLAAAGLAPSPEADRRTLIRRLHFDLTGLPPGHEDVERFVSDTAADAYEKLVDRLLESPHYGERWARHWLDVARYGETDGFERNSPRPNAWHYRDWVIRALNADVPYDRFARLQLAGDVLEPTNPDAVKATGFLVAGVHNTVLGNDQMRAVARQDELEDIVGNVAQTFLGLTANCARCHDHKFDPIAQADYYRLASALAGVGFGERAVAEVRAGAAAAQLAQEVEKLGAEVRAIDEPARKAVLAARGAAAAGPSPVAAWDFRTGGRDLVGALHAEPVGGAKFTPDGAALDGKGLFRTPPVPFDLTAKTLEAWVKVDPLSQRGGGVLSVQTPDGAVFDAVVYAENEPARWAAGSNSFARTKPFGGTDETDAAKEPVHVAISYAADGAVTAYRNGKPYGKGYASGGPVAFRAGKAVVVFGCRHEPAGGNRMLTGTVSGARLYDKALSPEEVAASFAAGGGFVTRAEIEAKLTPAQKAARADLLARRETAEAELAHLRARTTAARVYANVPQAAGVTRFLRRGDVASPGAAVAPGGLPAVPGPDADFRLPTDAPEGERRKKLAEWVTSGQNPLFSRVLVNRVWHHHFGTGLVDTPNDFGFSGGRPTHPELLDWLAGEFVARKYSLKALHRLIVTSSTYRQASAPRADALAKDADNRLLWRYRPRRLEAEAVRDAMLSASGLLNRAVGGKGFSDYRVRDFNGTAYFEPFDPVGPEFSRRSVYRFVPRGANPGLLDAFDCPDPAAAAPRRAVTTTPLQALALWNNGFALRCADALAARAAKEAPGAEASVRRMWALAYQRAPTPDELKLGLKLAADHGLAALARVLLNSNEFVTVE